MDEKLVEVGDLLITENCFGKSKYQITRITKTLAMSKREDGYEFKFKRQISGNMAHPYIEWSTTDYKVMRNGELI